MVVDSVKHVLKGTQLECRATFLGITSFAIHMTMVIKKMVV